MASKRDYTTRAREFSYRFPKLTFIGTQVNFWILAFLLYSTLSFLNNLYQNELGRPAFPMSYGGVVLTSIFMGMIFGITLGLVDIWIDRFRSVRLSVGRVILIKVVIYPIVLWCIIMIVRYALASHVSAFTDEFYAELMSLDYTWRFFYASLLLYTVFMAATISFINQMNLRFGPGVLIPMLLGRFRKPREQERFFMFLDMKASATHAEKLGKFLLIAIITSFSFSVYGQNNSSYLYNEKGQLRKDTSFAISKIQLKKWEKNENYILNSLIENIEYSEFAIANKMSGKSLVSFTLDSASNITEFRIIDTLGGGLEYIVERQLKKYEYLQSLSPGQDTVFTYFLPFEFHYLDANKYLKENNAIPISSVDFQYSIIF